MPECLLGSRASMWWVPGLVLGVATTFLPLAWLLSLPTWGRGGWVSPPPVTAYDLWVID
jgi:hypothetical protein